MARTALSALLVLFALLLPADFDELAPSAFLRVPVEALVGVVVLVALPARRRRAVAAVGGALLGLLLVVKVLDIGFDSVLYRPFDLVLDWPLLTPAVDYVAVTAGRAAAVGAVALVVALAVAAPVLVARSAVRLGGAVGAHRAAAVRVVALAAVCAVVLPVATHGTTDLVEDHARAVRAGLDDRSAFAAESAVDAFGDVPGDRLLTSLRDKDVLVVFVESYGRDAVEDPGVAAALEDGTRRLAGSGYASRSAFLTSPTAGGGSWLAQATLLSGLWVDNQQRYRTLVAGDRLTLGGAFRRAGWRSVGVMPGITQAWPEGLFFDYDRIYAAADLGYRGPRFGYATMPDQYVLAELERAERGARDEPVMAVVTLLSSHAPWTPLPEALPWDGVGDGAVFGEMLSGAVPPESIFGRDPVEVRADYGRSIEYSIDTIVSYLETYGDDDLVVVVLGDHQPAQMVTGEGASRDVPVTVVSRDRSVPGRAEPWGWTEGLAPAGDAPVRPMSAFRDQFLGAFS
ncbi:sulfatase-like hydrolase/transferase [Saccharothrix xinjiangensis]|uniref:Sulfatase-like hydrolase/transferase n=1 Tax=Saccharothrix xinjiangensis TaxID=204798 RepID=A0ABV9XXT0_9PSEU